jgi:hypothetical protein
MAKATVSNRSGIQKAFENLLAEIASAIADEKVTREEYHAAKMLEASIRRMFKSL